MKLLRHYLSMIVFLEEISQLNILLVEQRGMFGYEKREVSLFLDAGPENFPIARVIKGILR